MNFTGIIVGLATFLIIGVFHPIVIKAEYYFSKSCWPVFLAAGILRNDLHIGKQPHTLHHSRSDRILLILEHSRTEGAERTRKKRLVPGRARTQQMTTSTNQ